MRQISIHALLAESDTLQAQTSCWLMLDYFYPRSPCGERPLGVEPKKHNTEISIHALLAESDTPAVLVITGVAISIHALLAESDAYGRINDISRLIFLSTLSLRRATVLDWFSSGGASDFYPRSPCGERLTGDAVRHAH